MSEHLIEIERKFRLRAAPSAGVLAAHGAAARRIEQVYLDGGRDASRVRRSVAPDGTVTYRRTQKRQVGPFSFAEHEEAIHEGAWMAALERADPARRPIRKTRHVVPHGEQKLEIDVFEEGLAGLVVVEVELRHEDEAVELPAWLGEWREVTGDDRYFNASLSRLDAEVPPWG